jgi:hypothetical protein
MDSSDQNPTQSETDTVFHRPPTGNTSWQLTRWSRVRSIRSHRRLGFPALGEKQGLNDASMISSLSPSCSSTSPPGDVKVSSAGDVKEQRVTEKMNGPDEFADRMNQGKQIYMVSDGTGWTAEHSVYATLVQLQHCHGNRGSPVNTHLFSGVFLSFPIFIVYALIISIDQILCNSKFRCIRFYICIPIRTLCCQEKKKSLWPCFLSNNLPVQT